MRYLIGLLVLLFIVALVLRVPIYRAATWVIAASVLLLLGAFIVTSRNPAPGPAAPTELQVAEQAAKVEENQWVMVAPDKISIVSGALKAGDPKDEHHPMDYVGKVKNASDREIDKLAVRIRLYDCPGKPPANFVGCITIDDDIENVPVHLAPHETGDIAGHFQFHHLRETTGTFASRPEINRVRVAVQTAPAK